MRHLIFWFSLLPLALLLGSFLGALHPLGDSLAVFRGPLTAVAVVSVAVALRHKAWALAGIAGGLVLWSAFTVLAPRVAFSDASNAPYLHYQKNMLFKMASVLPLVDDILTQAPDFISLQEVSRKNRPVLEQLKAHYPAQMFCPFAGVGGVAVASRWPLIANSQRCEPRSGMAAMQVETPDGPVWVVSLHLHWPYPMGQAAQVRALLPQLAGLAGPVVLGGDFNMVPWSQAMRAITTASKTRRIGVPQYSLALKNLYGLPIDHVLVNRNPQPAMSAKRPLLGSDHFGVLARFSIK